jgi:D-arginine dehydrogenase
VLLDVDKSAARPAPVVWNVEDELYFRPESGALLASSCDEHQGPETTEALSHALESLSVKLQSTAPSLSRANVKRTWYGLRTFARDRAIAIGADPRRQGLYWFVGLGGHGMSSAVAAGEQLARIVHGEPSPFSQALGVARLLE